MLADPYFYLNVNIKHMTEKSFTYFIYCYATNKFKTQELKSSLAWMDVVQGLSKGFSQEIGQGQGI